jgi:YgiT-type zinc finger domain-containing protein
MEIRFPDEETRMTCVICKHGETNPGAVAVTLQRGETTVILKQVPAQICDNCGEHYLPSDIAALVMEKAERAVGSGAEVEILRFAA